MIKSFEHNSVRMMIISSDHNDNDNDNDDDNDNDNDNDNDDVLRYLNVCVDQVQFNRICQSVTVVTD